MKKLVIQGPTQLKGEIKIQGGKNSGMRLVILPLLSTGKFRLENIPDIGSTKVLASAVSDQGVKVNWQGKNTVEIDTSEFNSPVPIAYQTFFYTSVGINLVPIIVNRFEKCQVKIEKKRTDTGGDQIGRSLERTLQILSECGIVNQEKRGLLEFRLNSRSPFVLDSPIGGAFGRSMVGLLCALGKKGTCLIKNYARDPEFLTVINFLQLSGVEIETSKNDLAVRGPAILKGINFTNASDKNDFVTWIFAAIATQSEIELENVSPDLKNLIPLNMLLNQWKIKLSYSDHRARLNLKNSHLFPIDLIAGNYPKFHTDWQPLIAPILTQLDGISSIVESYFVDRLGYWQELGKMGAKFEYYRDLKYSEVNSKPRAVRVWGPSQLHEANVSANDVRAGAALSIAALLAKGQTEINGLEQIERGYESFPERLTSLGVKVSQKP